MNQAAVRRLNNGWLSLLLAMGCSAATASTPPDQPYGTVGWLAVSGDLQEAACQLDMASSRQTIELPAVSLRDLQRPGDGSEPTAFSLRLNGCIRAAGSVLNSQNNTLAWSSQQPIATLTFAAPADMNVPELFQVQGAEGIALRLRDASGNTLRPGTAGAPLFMNPGDNTLMFTVAVERTAAPLLANSYRATLDFHLHYQ